MRRKEYIERSSDEGKVPGIYQIKSKNTGRIYVGSTSRTVNSRIFHGHLWYLKNQKHGNKFLQRHFNKYGKEDLEFYLLEPVEREENEKIQDYKERILGREQYWIDRLEPHFNICENARSTLGTERSKEIRQKTTGENNGMYGVTGEDHPSYGKSRPEYIKEAVRKANTGRERSEESRQKQSKSLKEMYSSKKGRKLKIKKSKMYKGEGNPFYGKNHSEETKEKLRKAQTGRKQSKEEKEKRSNSLKQYYQTEEGEETKQKISKVNKGKSPWNKGKKLTEEHKQKISDGLKKNNGMLGKKHSEETKRKMREAWKRRKARKNEGG